MKTITRLLVLVAVLAMGVVAFAWSGVYNIAADDAHLAPTHALLNTLRENSIESRASKLTVPDLSDPTKALQGAGNYNAMCVGCHLAPGMAATEMSRGLYPAPPNLSETRVDKAAAFWVIKHGIKASGMPAWGKSMDDAYIWNMAAFLERLPTLDRAGYDDMVARSGGHSHGGGESKPAQDESVPHEHAQEPAHHDAGEVENHHDEAKPHDHAATSAENATVVMKEHRHADGTVESHPVKVEPANHNDDGHKH